MIIRDAKHMGTIELAQGCIREHQGALDRLERLHDAYTGKATILKRFMLEGLPNNKLVHNYPRYIVAVAAGYLVGNPVSYQSEDEIGALDDAYRTARVDSVDSELAKDASKYGKGVELVYIDDNAQIRTSTLDPRSAFVVYDNTVEYKPILGVRYYPTYTASGAGDGYDVIVYDDTTETLYHGPSPEEALATTGEAKPHYFGRVPMVEYFNNDDETGDFEAVLSLIDAYDKLQSDRLNDNEQLVQSILVLTGARLEDEPDRYDKDGALIYRGRTAGQKLRQDKMLVLPDKDVTFQYLSKSTAGDEADVLRTNLKADIHKFSMIPDLTDENFAYNASGVAMKYKLFGLEQLILTKERWFKEALSERLALFCNMLSVLGQATIDPLNIEIVFRRSLPSNELEIAQMMGHLEGIVPRSLLIAQVPFVSDPVKALEALEAEREEDRQRQAAAFDMPLDDE